MLPEGTIRHVHVDIVMSELNNRILNKISITTPLYFRFVDDILLIMPKDELITSVMSSISITQDLQYFRGVGYIYLISKLENVHKPIFELQT